MPKFPHSGCLDLLQALCPANIKENHQELTSSIITELNSRLFPEFPNFSLKSLLFPFCPCTDTLDKVLLQYHTLLKILPAISCPTFP
ncbi:rCG56068 [Rattus norvegicus]|uniref:RCG56068 n=1 Tax=Rattus norvegicus TaxID=10116 RepID=A6IAL3_RAT|nr:rCG56068 [Rattus norvegicus]